MSFIPSGTRVAIVTCLVFLLLALALPVAQQSPPIFRTGVEVVVLDVSVLDKDRRPVRGLTAADFTIVEDGKPQNIQTFKAIDLEDVAETLPVRWVREVTPDVRRNDEFSDHRVVVILLDDATPMPAPEVPRARQLAQAAIDSLGPDDLAAVLYVQNKRAGQDFTIDRHLLRASVDKFNGGIDKVWEMDGTLKGAVAPVPFSAFGGGTAATLYGATADTLRSVADSLADLPQSRKALMFVSVGMPIDLANAQASVPGATGMDTTGIMTSLIGSLQDAIRSAQRANVAIYGLDPGGLRMIVDTGTLDIGAGRLNQDFLVGLSGSTGGFAVTDTNDPLPGITQAFRENSSYYVVGYQPANAQTQGRFRKIDVRVNRPGVTVRTRSGYFEPRAEKPGAKPGAGSPPAPLAEALAGLLPLVGIPLRVNAASFARAGSSQADVAVAVDVSEVIPAGRSVTTDDVDVLVHAYDMQGQLRASDRATVRLTFRLGSGESARYGVLSRLTIAPGHYQLRVAVRSSALGKSGSVYTDLEVPDFWKPALSLSGVVLDVLPAVLSAPKGKLSSLLPVLPTAQREFTAGEEVGAFLRVYQGGKGPPSAVIVTTRVVDGSDTDLFSKTDTLGQDRFGPARTADYRVTLPVASLARGPRLVSIAATCGTLTAKRELRITLR